MVLEWPEWIVKAESTPHTAPCIHVQVQPILHIEGFGDRTAEVVCQQMKITSQNDTKKLAEAKAATYLKGFTHGVMIVGPHKGKKVSLKPYRKSASRLTS